MENATGFREAKMQAHTVSVVEYGMDNKKDPGCIELSGRYP